jgi:hypothetical protein
VLSTTHLTVLQQQDDTSVLPLNQSLLHAFTAQAAITAHYNSNTDSTSSKIVHAASESAVQLADSILVTQQQDEDEL